MVFFQFIQAIKEELFGPLLQSLPVFGRFNHEGFIVSHGCISFHRFRVCLNHIPRYTRSPTFTQQLYATVGSASRFRVDQTSYLNVSCYDE